MMGSREHGGWLLTGLAALLVLAGCSEDSDDGGSRGGTGGNAGGGLSTGGTGGGDWNGSPGGETNQNMFDTPGSGGSGAAPSGPNCNQDVDVVFVLDVSGSMIPPLTFVQDEVAAVDAALQTKNLPTPPQYGLVIFVDDVLVHNSGQPYADVAAFTAAVSTEIMTTNINAPRQAVGGFDNLNWPENSLDALYAAANDYAWRPVDTTLRTLIHVTDASFWDQDLVSSTAGDPMGLEAPGTCTAGTPCSVHSYDETIEALRAQSIWVNTFAAKTGGPPGATVSPPSHGAFRGSDVNVGIGFFEPYIGKPSIAASTGGNAFDIDEVFDGIISLATPINDSIANAQCMEYPPIPVL